MEKKLINKKEKLRFAIMRELNIDYIINPSLDAQIEAVIQDGWYLKYIETRSEEVHKFSSTI